MDGLISRQAAIDAADKIIERDTSGSNAVVNAMIAWSEYIKTLPSAQLEPQWIPCIKRLPEEPFGCLVTVWDTNPITMDEFENILPYFVGWDGEQWNDADGEQCPFEVIAWMPLPEPYAERREE